MGIHELEKLQTELKEHFEVIVQSQRAIKDILQKHSNEKKFKR